MSNRRILCVDDEPRFLEALQRMLDDRFELSTAESGEEGLQILVNNGPFAAILSDLRMPHMDGTAFLGRAQKLAPESMRILLTGNIELRSAIDVVNRSGIFRLLCKPCPNDVLEQTLEAAIEQYRLMHVERELLEHTLAATLNILSDFLGLVAPTLFARANRLRDCVSHMVKRIGIADAWQYEVAATLSQIGLAAVPLEVIERALSGRQMTAPERQLLADHPSVGHRILAQIPRFDKIAAMVRDQRSPRKDEIAPVVIGAGMLRVATELDLLLGRGIGFAEAHAALSSRGCDAQLVAALADYRPIGTQDRARSVTVAELKPGMVLRNDIKGRNGNVLVSKESVVTAVLIDRIRRFALTIGIVEPLVVKSTA